MTKQQKPKRVRKPRQKTIGGLLTHCWRGSNGHFVAMGKAKGGMSFLICKTPRNAREIAAWFLRWADWREQQETEGRG